MGSPEGVKVRVGVVQSNDVSTRNERISFLCGDGVGWDGVGWDGVEMRIRMGGVEWDVSGGGVRVGWRWGRMEWDGAGVDSSESISAAH